MELYYVGGYVRDKLLGLESNDIDFTVVINEKVSINEGFKMLEEFLIDNGYKIFLKTESMLTIRANNLKNVTADFVLARKEIYTNPETRQPIVELGTLYDDLLRRDFTVNALAMDMSGNIIDICDGKKDLENRILKTPKDPLETLNDDPLRALRAMRFHITKDFDIDEHLLEAIINPVIIDKLFTVVSIDRIREELTKMFMYSTPKTLQLLNLIDNKIPKFIERLFNHQPLKLLPTTKIHI